MAGNLGTTTPAGVAGGTEDGDAGGRDGEDDGVGVGVPTMTVRRTVLATPS